MILGTEAETKPLDMVETLRKKMKSLALAEAILSPEWEYRYFSYDSKWSEAEEVASMRDGSGNHWFLWLCRDLAAYKCCSLDDGLAGDVEGVKSTFPHEYRGFLDEPAFSMGEATCIWRWGGSEWIKHGLAVRDMVDLERVVAWTADDYGSWARAYYEIDIDGTCLQRLFDGEFSERLAMKLNPDVDLVQLKSDMEEIGITP